MCVKTDQSSISTSCLLSGLEENQSDEMKNNCEMALLKDIRMQFQMLMRRFPNSVIKLHSLILSELEVCCGIFNSVKRQICPSMNFMVFSQVENSSCSLVNDVIALFFLTVFKIRHVLFTDPLWSLVIFKRTSSLSRIIEGLLCRSVLPSWSVA